MPELPKKKVGIISCSGEEIPEGTVARLAALRVLEQLRPNDTVTICLPLFLAGGEGDRAFAKFYPTIAVDGCEKRCAYRGTEKYSNTPAGSIIISELVARHNLSKPEGKRKLDAAGMQVVNAAAEQIASTVDDLLDKAWKRSEGKFVRPVNQVDPQMEVVATCSCGSGIPIQDLTVNGKKVTFLALPIIFQTFHEARKSPSEPVLDEMIDMAKIYNAVEPADEEAVRQEIDREYRIYWKKHAAAHE